MQHSHCRHHRDSQVGTTITHGETPPGAKVDARRWTGFRQNRISCLDNVLSAPCAGGPLGCSGFLQFDVRANLEVTIKLPKATTISATNKTKQNRPKRFSLSPSLRSCALHILMYTQRAAVDRNLVASSGRMHHSSSRQLPETHFSPLPPIPTPRTRFLVLLQFDTASAIISATTSAVMTRFFLRNSSIAAAALASSTGTSKHG